MIKFLKYSNKIEVNSKLSNEELEVIK